MRCDSRGGHRIVQSGSWSKRREAKMRPEVKESGSLTRHDEVSYYSLSADVAASSI